MKFRTGFVSNSSSSSYVIITTKETYDKVLSKLTEFERGAVEAEFQFEKENVFGKNMLVCCREICTEDIGCDWDFLPEDQKETESDAWQEAYDGLDKFFNLMLKEKDSFAKNYMG